jgi:hypothetical protein
MAKAKVTGEFIEIDVRKTLGVMVVIAHYSVVIIITNRYAKLISL